MFEYDLAKSAANTVKHGIDFDTAKELWRDDQRVDIAARAGVYGEERRLVIGLVEGRLWAAVVTRRGDNLRIISVRRARDDERDLYRG